MYIKGGWGRNLGDEFHLNSDFKMNWRNSSSAPGFRDSFLQIDLKNSFIDYVYERKFLHEFYEFIEKNYLFQFRTPFQDTIKERIGL